MVLRLMISLVAIFGFASVAAAQDQICGGIGDDGAWAGGEAETSDIATADAPFDASGVSARGENIVTLFAVSETAQVRLEAQPTDGGDTVIELFGDAGTRILTDDDSGEGSGSMAETELAPGTYCLVTSSYSGAGQTADIRIGLTSHEPMSPVGETSVSQACAPGAEAADLHDGPIAGLAGEGLSATASVRQTPAYRFTLAEPTAMTIYAEGTPADPVLHLFDGEGALLGENDDADGRNARLDFPAALPAGDYCIGLRALSDENAPVRVSLVPHSVEAVLSRLYATGKAAPPPGSDHPVMALDAADGRLIEDVVLDKDAVWLRFSVPASGMMVIEAVALGEIDPAITLFDELGRTIMHNDDMGQGNTDSLIATRIAPGEYLLAVTRIEDGVATPVRLAIERFVPAGKSIDR